MRFVRPEATRCLPCTPRKNWHHSGTRKTCPGRRSKVCRHEVEVAERGSWAPSPLNWCSGSPPLKREKKHIRPNKITSHYLHNTGGFNESEILNTTCREEKIPNEPFKPYPVSKAHKYFENHHGFMLTQKQKCTRCQLLLLFQIIIC